MMLSNLKSSEDKQRFLEEHRENARAEKELILRNYINMQGKIPLDIIYSLPVNDYLIMTKIWNENIEKEQEELNKIKR